MSEVKLSDEITIDSSKVESAKLVRGGQKTGAKALALSSPDPVEVTAPEDEVIVHLRGGTQFAIRGEKQAKAAWDALTRARETESLKFDMELKDGR